MLRIRPDVDLTPPERALRQRMNPLEFGVAVVLLCILVLLCGQSVIAWSVNRDLGVEIQRAEQRMITLRNADREARQLERELASYRVHATLIYKVLADVLPWHGILYELGKATPVTVWVTSVTADGRDIFVDGYGFDHDDVAYMAVRVGASPLFEDATLRLSERAIMDGEKVYRFRLVARCNW